MTFKDIFKSKFVDNVASFSLTDMLIALILALIIGVFIMLVYKKTFRGVMYSHSFSVTLLALSLITTLIILAVTSNVILSLGMVGALSIVRFRTAIKEPLDIAFLFWSICTGIILGAGLIPLAIFGSIIIGLIMLLLVNKKSYDAPYILVLNCNEDNAENNAFSLISTNVKKYAVKSKTVSQAQGIELTLEVVLKDSATTFVNELSKLEGVRDVVLVSYNGEYAG